MAFKGTQKRTQQALELEVENLGAHLNAYTSREQTVYYAKAFRQDVPQAVDIISDILQNSKLEPSKIERERDVILREQVEVDKQHEEVVFDHLHAVAFQGQPLGRTILGPRQNILSIKREHLESYIKTNYTPDRMVLVGSGGVDHQELVKLAEKQFSSLPQSANPAPLGRLAHTKTDFVGSEVRIRDDTMSTCNVAIAVEGVSWSSPDYFPMLVMQSIFGNWDRSLGASPLLSSRLSHIISSNNLANSFMSFSTSYSDTGLWGIYLVSENLVNLDDMVHFTLREWTRMSISPKESEVERAKSQLKATLLLSLDGTSAIAEDIGRQVVTSGRRFTPKQIENAIEAVTVEEIKRVAQKYLWDKDFALAAYGRVEGLLDYNRIRADMSRFATSSHFEGMPPPLKGIKILDLSRVLAAPLCSMLLADLGADVVKVESLTGDDTRSWHPPSARLPEGDDTPLPDQPPESAYFLCVNRNKRSISVNFKTSQGLEIIHRLILGSDVLIENYIPGKLGKLGLDYDTCRDINPGLIYTSISGYGQTGPYATYAGYDVVIEAEAGLMHITGDPHGPPAKVGVAATDVATGLYAHGAILAALLSRQQTGRGIAGLANIASNYLIAGVSASRHGTGHPSIVPYQVFPCEDGDLMIGVGNDNQFKIFCDILGKQDLGSSDKFSTNGARVKNREELVAIIESTMQAKPSAHWTSRLSGKGIPFGPINDIKGTFEHPQVVARNLVVEVDHPRAGKIKLVGPAVTYNGGRMRIRLPPPYLGQHTREVLEDIGYIDEEIKELMLQGVIR
ncbi:hypothetical protein FRC17_008650 [Serendipita sp. 399]|nr:hypothetical protein FRC17_008650 [Serendipita sp. 399]